MSLEVAQAESGRQTEGDDDRLLRRPSEVWIENRPARRWSFRLDLQELWAYRELAFALASRELKLRYKQTVFGVAWVLLQPVLAAILFALIFGRAIGVPSDGLPYALFAYAGLVIWTGCSTGLGRAAESLTADRSLVTKVYFPRALAPLAALLPSALDLAIATLLAGVLLPFYGVSGGTKLVLTPLWLVAGVAVTAGPALWLSALNVLYRDVRYALNFALQAWLFLSPVVFPSSLVHGWARYLFSINPLVGVIDGFRWSLLGAPAPRIADVISLISAAVLFVTGTFYFRKVERRFADRI